MFDILNNLLKTFDNDYITDKTSEKSLPSAATNTAIIRGGKRKRTEDEKNSDGKFVCQDCDYKTKHNGHLRRHVESMHEGVRYPCSQCEFKVTQAAKLKRHVESIHEGVRYPCSQCEYKAPRQDELKKHVESIRLT